MSKLSIIAIVARDGAIGRGGDQPFHISDDFKHFKALTLGHPIVMGRRTFEALPKGALPNRRNLVLTRNESWSAPGAERVSSIGEALELCREANEIFIIGGGEIYRQAMPMASTLYITMVYADVPDADTHFPAIDPARFHLTESSEPKTDPRSGATYRFQKYEAKGE